MLVSFQHRPAFLTSYTCFCTRYANCLPHYVLNGNSLWTYKLQVEAQKNSTYSCQVVFFIYLCILYMLAFVACLRHLKKTVKKVILHDYKWSFILK